MKNLVLLVLCVLSFGHVTGQIIDLSQVQRAELLAKHNFYRSQIGSPALRWSDDLARQARRWLKVFHQRPLLPRNTYDYEQNMSILSDTSNITIAVARWAQEQIYYNGDFSDSARTYLYQHYYRIVNPKFTRLGCALMKQADGVYVLVCFYSP